MALDVYQRSTKHFPARLILPRSFCAHQLLFPLSQGSSTCRRPIPFILRHPLSTPTSSSSPTFKFRHWPHLTLVTNTTVPFRPSVQSRITSVKNEQFTTGCHQSLGAVNTATTETKTPLKMAKIAQNQLNIVDQPTNKQLK